MMNGPILKDYWRNAMNDSLEADTRPMSTQVTDSSRHNTALKAQNTASQHCLVWDTKLPCHNVLQELGFLTLVCSGNTSEIQRWNISHPEIWSISKHITKCKNTKNILNRLTSLEILTPTLGADIKGFSSKWNNACSGVDIFCKQLVEEAVFERQPGAPEKSGWLSNST